MIKRDHPASPSPPVIIDWSIFYGRLGSTLPENARRSPSKDGYRLFIPGWDKYASSFIDRKSTRLNSSHQIISYAVFCLKKKKHNIRHDGIKEITRSNWAEAEIDHIPTKNQGIG